MNYFIAQKLEKCRDCQREIQEGEGAYITPGDDSVCEECAEIREGKKGEKI